MPLPCIPHHSPTFLPFHLLLSSPFLPFFASPIPASPLASSYPHNSLQLPSQVSSLLQSTTAAVAGPDAAAALSDLQPHFGSRALAGAVQQLAAAAPRLPGVPSLPSLDAAGVCVAVCVKHKTNGTMDSVCMCVCLCVTAVGM